MSPQQSAPPTTTQLRRLKQLLECRGPLPELSEERFDRSHELFESSSDQQPQLKSWLQKLVESECGEASRLRILSIGCGSGILDLPLIGSLASGGRQLDYTGVDPNPVACSRFQRGFDQLGIDGVRLDLRRHGVDGLSGADRYDLIHAVHCFYYFLDPAAVIDALLQRLAAGGRLAIAQAPKGELNQLADCFWPRPTDAAIWFSGQLMEHLELLGIDYRVERIDAAVDITPCFESHCSRGELLLDFITQTDTQAMNAVVKETCLDYLCSVATTVDGRKFVAHPVDVLVMTSPAPTRPCH